jgi:hypothetical protein
LTDHLYRDAKTGEFVDEEYALANPDTTVRETIEQPTVFSEQDVRDLHELGVTDGDVPSYHVILEVWREVLKPAHAERESGKVTPQWAGRMVSSYQELRFADCQELQRRYFDKLIDLHQVIVDEIEGDDECLNYTDPEEDAKENRDHYLEILRQWQEKFLRWELEWDCTDTHAAIELAAISETYKVFFGQTGLTQ